MAFLSRLSLFLYLLSNHSTSAAPAKPHQPIRAQTPVRAHESGGVEHIVIIDRNAPIPPRVEDILERLALHPEHSDVRRIFNNSAFQGFSASMKSHCLDALGKMNDVSMVETATTVPGAFVGSRPNAPWGLQRISSMAVVDGNDQSLDFTYSYDNQDLGNRADIYIVDTGIYTENNVFGGRAKMLWSFDGDMKDNDGHGTHVSGTAGANILGVASNANILGIKALDTDGSGWSSDVIAAIDQVIQLHDARKASGPSFIGSVMSMSIASSGNVASMNAAIRAAIAAGVHTVVAAGNDGDDACNASPASAGGTHGPAITVGAVDMLAQPASFSNHGPCVDLYAPGVSVISAWPGGPNMINTLSGTSMATPHVTGIVAYAMANATLAGSPALMKEWVGRTALFMSNGILLANNGARPNEGWQGMLGFEKVDKVEFNNAKVDRPVRTGRKKVGGGGV